MCSTLRPRSSSSTRSPFSVSSFAAHPPDIPDPTTIASYSGFCISMRSAQGISNCLLGQPRHDAVAFCIRMNAIVRQFTLESVFLIRHRRFIIEVNSSILGGVVFHPRVELHDL